MSKSNAKLKKSRLFSTLASIEQADASATKRRKQSRLRSLRQSRAAADQAKINGVLLELRILTQRCLAEEGGAAASNSGGAGGGRVKEEVDALLENLLVARRELVGHQLDDCDGGGDGDDESSKKEVNYAKLIRQTKEGNDEDETSSDGDNSTDSDKNKNNLAKQLRDEHASLRNHWKSVLNKHHSNLALHSGMSVNGSKFQSRAVDVSFWEQVRGGMEHERFKQRGNSQTNEQGDGNGNNLHFDDSKLYQQMLKDFIASSQTGGTSSSKSSGKRGGLAMDPAQEAAERLKRAVRKKSGAGGDVDLTSLLTNSDANPDVVAQNAIAKKKAVAVDRRASKGRKIRYTVHPKLVNFTFPVSRPEPMIKEDVWFKSLFGGVGRVQKK